MRREPARNRAPVEMPIPISSASKAVPSKRRSLRQLFVDFGKRHRHTVGGFAGMDRVFGIVERRVPVGGEAFAVETGDHAAMAERIFDQRRIAVLMRRVNPAGSSAKDSAIAAKRRMPQDSEVTVRVSP